MKVKDLIKFLNKVDGDLDIVVDRDNDGWYDLENVQLTGDDEGGVMLNLVTSNDS